MTADQAKMYDCIADEIEKNHATEVDIRRFHVRSQTAAYETACSRSYQMQLSFRHPELFYARIRAGSWNPYTGEDTSMTVTYLTSRAKIKAMTRQYDRALNKIVTKAEKEKTKKKQVAVVNEEICRICSYDSSGKSAHHADAYGCLVEKKALCTGYALGAAACFRKLGIENSFVYSAKKNHIWNKVKIGGRWYQVDVCWNDRGKNASTEYLLKTHLKGH